MVLIFICSHSVVMQIPLNYSLMLVLVNFSQSLSCMRNLFVLLIFLQICQSNFVKCSNSSMLRKLVGLWKLVLHLFYAIDVIFKGENLTKQLGTKHLKVCIGLCLDGYIIWTDFSFRLGVVRDTTKLQLASKFIDHDLHCRWQGYQKSTTAAAVL